LSSALTDLQTAFAIAYATNGGNATAAAIEAGYSENSAVDLGRRALSNPQVQDLILIELTRLRCRSGAIGLHALIRIAQSSTAPAAAVVAAGRALTEHAGLLGPGKEMESARARASDPNAGNVQTYTEVLDHLARLPRLVVDNTKAVA
jgi:hypothetical protein